MVLAFARRHPDRLDRLVVISGWVYDEQLLPIMRWARVPGLGEALYGTFYRNAIGERLYLNFVDPNLVTQKVVDEVEKQMALDGAIAAALAAARGMHRFAETEARVPHHQEPDAALVGPRRSRGAARPSASGSRASCRTRASWCCRAAGTSRCGSAPARRRRRSPSFLTSKGELSSAK